jgi:hypothetical protein
MESLLRGNFSSTHGSSSKQSYISIDRFKDPVVQDNIYNICEIFDQTIKQNFQNDMDKYWIPLSSGSNYGLEFSGCVRSSSV